MRAFVVAVPLKAWPTRKGLRQVAAAATAAVVFRASPCFPESIGDVSTDNKNNPSEQFPASRWALREYELPGDRTMVEVLEGRFVFTDGAGVRVWPASSSTVSYLRATGLGSDNLANSEGESDGNAVSSWKGRQVLDLGCGCGLVAIALSRWGSKVVAVDTNVTALALTEANVERNQLQTSKRLECRHLDWGDLAACAQLRQELGPFDAIVVSDGVLIVPPSGPMWRVVGTAEGMVSPPGPLLDATRELGHGGAEIILTVVDRAGDVTETARALLDRRHWLELIGPPRDIPAENGKSSVTVFHFRWKTDPGKGGEVTRGLWSAI